MHKYSQFSNKTDFNSQLLAILLKPNFSRILFLRDQNPFILELHTNIFRGPITFLSSCI